MQNVPTIRLVPKQGEDLERASIDVFELDRASLQALADADWNLERWQALLSVTVNPGAVLEPESRPAMVGKYHVVGDVLRFQPTFPLERGLRYQAVFDPSKMPGNQAPASGTVSAVFTLPERERTSSTTVTRVDPAAGTLPENTLRLYVHFSAPMSRGDSYDYVHLQKAGGGEVDLPFLELGEELWDPSGRRLTLIFDPGRIKRGLVPREEEGPILEEGKRYSFVIDRDWPDAEGNPLKEGFRKTFDVGPPDETAPDPKGWTLAAPRSGTRDPLRLTFPEPLDRPMLDRVVSVKGPEGKPLPGTIDVAADATRWWFKPEKPWKAGSYQLLVDTALEDLAGNGIGRPFEVDLTGPITRRTATETIALPFTVEPGGPPGDVGSVQSIEKPRR